MNSQLTEGSNRAEVVFADTDPRFRHAILRIGGSAEPRR